MSVSDEVPASVHEGEKLGRDSLIALLQQEQQEHGFISREAAASIGHRLSIATSKVYGVATFYNQFRFTPPGRFHIQTCRGTACHINRSKEVLDCLTQELGIKPGSTTRDGRFSLEVVACLGACGQSPVVSIDGEFHGGMSAKKVKELLSFYRAMPEETGPEPGETADSSKPRITTEVAAEKLIPREERFAELCRDVVTRPVIYVGTGTCGLGAGAGKTLTAVERFLEKEKIDAEVVGVGCIGLCASEPLLDIQLPGRARVCFAEVTEDKVAELLGRVFHGPFPGELSLGQHRNPHHEPYADVRFMDELPFFERQTRRVLENCGFIDPDAIDEYIAHGGYRALEQTLQRTPEEVCDIVSKSGLRGRGGGGFPTGKKWRIALAQDVDQKYLICNADEGDPGAFMDRAVIEGDPHRVLEGMAIAAHAIGATKAYVYIRAEYPLAIQRLETAIAEARLYGFVGSNIMGSGRDLEIAIKKGAGAFVCGEETALIGSIEGRRGMPRPRPPFPAVEGLFGKPTVINNVETLANLPGIIRNGHEWFSAVGTDGSKGTKVFALSGKIKRTGLIEVAMGTTLRDIVFGAGGGIPNGKAYKAVQIGGPSGGCIPAQHLDIDIDYESLKTVGAIMGSGGLVVMDEDNCMVDVATFFMEFIQNESCGKCIPCREGTRRLLEILRRVGRNRNQESGYDALIRFKGMVYLERLAKVIKDTSLCGLGQTAPNPVLSTLRWFRDEYEAHVYDRRCPAGVCKNLVGAPCQSACPVGTEVWRYVAHIGRGEYEEAYRVIREANPFPSVCARVCNHPCESACRAGITGGEPIAVRALKRFVTDHVDPGIYKTVVRPAGADAPRIAVIGAGPAGLTAAHDLSVRGFPVTLFEKENKPGGMLLCGIPEYRMPRDTLAKEIHSLLNENITLKCGVSLGKDFTAEGLLAEGFQAVYVAIGSHRSIGLDLDGENAEGIFPAIEFLKAQNLRNVALARGGVGVIGGGNSAIDAARVALRQNGVRGVTIYYRRTRTEMPAFEEEIEAALDEGIDFVPLVSPVALQTYNGRLTGLGLIRNELGEPDASGRQRPVPIPGSEYTVQLDTLIVAIGERPDIESLRGLDVSKRGTLVVNPESTSTSTAGIFAGGDVTTGPNTVVDSIAAGKRAAVMIERYITGKQPRLVDEVRLPTVYVEPPTGMDTEISSTHRVEIDHLRLKSRRKNFREVELCISELDALREARRCLRCDVEFSRPQGERPEVPR
jgi:NADH-quinone oxidoreductase subunit F